jgi:hypothetical protein
LDFTPRFFLCLRLATGNAKSSENAHKARIVGGRRQGHVTAAATNIAVAKGCDRAIARSLLSHRLRGLLIEKGSGEGIYVQLPVSL